MLLNYLLTIFVKSVNHRDANASKCYRKVCSVAAHTLLHITSCEDTKLLPIIKENNYEKDFNTTVSDSLVDFFMWNDRPDGSF